MSHLCLFLAVAGQGQLSHWNPAVWPGAHAVWSLSVVQSPGRERVGLHSPPSPTLPGPLCPRAPVQAVWQPCPHEKTSFTLLHLAGRASSQRPEEVELSCRKGRS